MKIELEVSEEDVAQIRKWRGEPVPCWHLLARILAAVEATRCNDADCPDADAHEARRGPAPPTLYGSRDR